MRRSRDASLTIEVLGYVGWGGRYSFMAVDVAAESTDFERRPHEFWTASTRKLGAIELTDIEGRAGRARLLAVEESFVPVAPRGREEAASMGGP
jgi:hypothetical protein